MASRAITFATSLLALAVALAAFGVPSSSEAPAVLGQKLLLLGALGILQQVGNLPELVLQEQVAIVVLLRAHVGCCACKACPPASADPLAHAA